MNGCMHTKQVTGWQEKGKYRMKNNGKREFLSLLGILVGFVVVMTGIARSADMGEETRIHRIEVMSRYENLDGTEYEEVVEESDITGEVKQQEEELKQISIKKLTSQIKGFTIQWKKTEDKISGYQIAYSTGKDPEAKKAVRKNVGNTKTKYSVKKLKGNQQYYVWIRSFLTVDGEKVYSQWSKTKSVTTDAYLVAVDAGHQSRANVAKEPNGPGSSVMKMKVTGGTQGRFTNQTEYALNLSVAKKLKEIFEKRGYKVLMIRESNNVNISNVERAKIANKNKADVFIRIHANGSENFNANGAMTICQTSQNPYCKATYKKSRKLSDCVLNGIVKNTGCRKEGVWETDTMTGINWCQVPVTIVEMGYLSNQKEDRLLATDSYRKKMAVGIADGIDEYFK